MIRKYGSDFTRKLWSDVDHILLVYVGSAAEFALVEDNHWLFYTNKLPSAPLDRLLSTFVWNRKVMMTSVGDAPALARTIRGFHDQVESERAREEGGHPRISNQGFKAVGAMLIEYALIAEAYLEQREVGSEEKENYYQDQRGFFEAMGIEDWEPTYAEFARRREDTMPIMLKTNQYTDELFASYKRDIGIIRYWVLRQFMAWFVPAHVATELGLRKIPGFGFLYRLYPKLHGKHAGRWVRKLLLPGRVLQNIQGTE
ncbi:MAG: oxygenase MpaB family protein [Kiritimatiellia bacterium]